MDNLLRRTEIVDNDGVRVSVDEAVVAGQSVLTLRTQGGREVTLDRQTLVQLRQALVAKGLQD